MQPLTQNDLAKQTPCDRPEWHGYLVARVYRTIQRDIGVVEKKS
jgi:hypothetical protein